MSIISYFISFLFIILMFHKIELRQVYQYLLISLAFLMPITVFGANLVIVIICLLWLCSGDYKVKVLEILNNKILIASVLFFALHVFGLLWTDDLNRGYEIVHKMWYFGLLLPILFSITEQKYIRYYVGAFLIAMILSVILSFSIWLEVIQLDSANFWITETHNIKFFKADNSSNPDVFMSHISYNPLLTLAIYLVAHPILFDKNLTTSKRFLYFLVALLMVINMFITGGRAGQVMFFVMLAFLIYQYYPFQKLKSLIVIFLVTSIVFLSAYHLSPKFNSRANLVISEIQNYDEQKNTSVGLRITFAMNSIEIIGQNLIIGVGTGDFSKEYRNINLKNTPNLPNATNPHNMYILVLVQLGLVGLLSMLSIFYYQVKFSFVSSEKIIRDFGLAMPILFLIIMLSDSYLLGHFTTLVFMFFSSFLYKNFEKN